MTSRYQRSPEIYRDPLTSEWVLLCNTLAGAAPALLRPAAEERLARFITPQPLYDDDDALLARAGLLIPSDIAPTPPGAETCTLTAWLHVTNACNLECPYCYVQKSSQRMDLATGQCAVDALITTAKQHGFTRLKLKYAGGETALHFRMVQQLHSYAVRQVASAGIALDAVVLSNGTIMPQSFADWFASSGVQLMISVDGLAAEHDRQRPRKGGGGGAFAALERNLVERLLPRGIRPTISITITGLSAHGAKEVVRWAISHDLPFSLNFYRESATSARYPELRFEEQQIINGMREAYAVIAELLPARPFLDGLLDRVQFTAHTHTCGVGRSYVVITHQGQLAQCQMALEEAASFDHTSDLIALTAAGPLHNYAVDAKEGCSTCQWRYRCAGGCPVLTFRATDRTDIKSPNCDIYMALLPEALRLEGLRLLKYRLGA
jgi:uncharacterized protein